MTFKKDNDEFNKGIRNTYFSTNSEEALFHLAEVQRDESETKRKLEELSKLFEDTNEVTESMEVDLTNLTNEYLSLARLKKKLADYCLCLLERSKREFDKEKEKMVSLNSTNFSQVIFNYFSSQIALEEEPYSENCGNIRRPNYNFKMGSFACLRKRKDDYILVMIAYPTDDERWVVYDAAPTDGTILQYTAKPHMLFPMTTSLPSKLGTDIELHEGDHVLSLWREDVNSIWTTQFYYGEIIENPKERGLGYKIRFDEDQSVELVPEHFVVSAADF